MASAPNPATDGLTVYQTAPLPALGVARVVIASGADESSMGADVFLWFDRGSAKPRARRLAHRKADERAEVAINLEISEMEAAAREWAQAEIYAVVDNAWRDLVQQHKADLQPVPPDRLMRWWLLQPNAEAGKRMADFFSLIRRSRCPAPAKRWLEQVEAMAPITAEPFE